MAGEANPLVPATVMPNYAQQGAIPTYPAPYGISQGGGTGGLVDKNKIINDSVQNAINQTQQLQKMHRDTQAYNEQQARNKAKGDLGTPDSPAASPTGDGHSDFMSSVLQGLHSLGTGVSNLFGGGAPAPQGAIPMQGPPAPIAEPQMQGPPAPMQAIPGQMNGGPVTEPEFMHPPGGMGVVGGAVHGISGFEDGGPIPADQPAPAVPPPPAAAAPPVDAAVPASSAHARAEAGRAIDEAHQLLDNHTLDHNDVPKAAALAATAANSATPPGASAQGVPAPQAAATAQVAQQTAQNPDAQAGDPGPASRPHSITPEQWDAYEKRKEYAVKMAAYAGEDPGQVRNALDASRNAWVQGGVLRYLSAANSNLLSGNQKGVEQALKNAYYYLPDGRDLTIEKDKNGNLTYQDPMNPKTADGKPNMIPVDAAHIQMLGQAMLDPMAVQTTIQNAMSAHAKIQLEQAQSQAALLTGHGNEMKGHGIEMGGEARKDEVNSTNYNKFATGEAALIHANAIANHLKNVAAKMPNIDPEILKAANSASDQFDKQAAGEYGTIPLMVPDTRPGHQGEMTQNQDPNAGKPMRDPSKIPAELKDLTPSQQMEGRAVAGNITLANPRMPPAEAVRLAALYAAGKLAKPSGPKGKDGKPGANVYTDTKTGDTHVWNKSMKKWEVFKLPLQSSQDLATTGSILPAGSNGEDGTTNALLAQSPNYGGQGGIPGGQADLEAAKNEPDMEPQQFPTAAG